jgi:DNA-binding SARP family transcriptional activator
MAIDPYHPFVVKNSRLLEQRSISVMEPIASLDNMEKFRDASFDMKAHFGIDDAHEDPMKPLSNRYDTNKRAEQIERE